VPIFLANEDGSYVPAQTSSSASLVVLSADIPADQISADLGITPDRWWVRGEFEFHPQDSRSRHSRPFPFNGWELASQLPETAPPEDHLVDLLERIGPAGPRVAALVGNPQVASVRLRVGHHTDNANPGLSLSDSLLQRVGALGTGVELDVYVDAGEPPTESDDPGNSS
jgi:hypothetical protein